MINKRRVQRIRGFLYTCILLVIIVPIILMLVVSVRTLGMLGELREHLTQPQTSNVEPTPQSVGKDHAKPQQGDTGGAGAQGTTLTVGDSAETTWNEGGRGTENTYLPPSYPELLFDDMPVFSPSTKNTIYLTFDNTPSAQANEILSVLEKHGVRATFFVWWNDYIGEGNRTFYRKLSAGGHQIGIHCASNRVSYSQLYNGVDSYLEQFSEIYDIILQETGTGPRLYRLPGGSVNTYDSDRQQVLLSIKAELDARGFLQYDWSASAQDAVSPTLTKGQILQNIESSLDGNGHAIILLHDGTGSTSTAEALDEFIQKYKDNGYSFGILEYTLKPVSFLDG